MRKQIISIVIEARVDGLAWSPKIPCILLLSGGVFELGDASGESRAAPDTISLIFSKVTVYKG